MCLSQEDFVLCLSQEGFVDRVFPLTPCFKLDREMVVGLAELRVLASYCEVFIFRTAQLITIVGFNWPAVDFSFGLDVAAVAAPSVADAVCNRCATALSGRHSPLWHRPKN